MMQKMTIPEFAEYVFQNRDKKLHSLFHEDFHQEAIGFGKTFIFAVMPFAGSPSVIINFDGGGWMFCYEFGDEDDPSGFEEHLSAYLFPFGITDHVWTDKTFSLPFMDCEVDEYGYLMLDQYQYGEDDSPMESVNEQ